MKQRLVGVQILVMAAVISGSCELSDVMEYFSNKMDFHTTLYVIAQYPSKPTLNRILNMINGEAVGQAIVENIRVNWAEIVEIIAVDRKAVRSSGEKGKGKAHTFLRFLTTYATESGITLGQTAIVYKNKISEIPVFQTILDSLSIKGKTITADAIILPKRDLQ